MQKQWVYIALLAGVGVANAQDATPVAKTPQVVQPALATQIILRPRRRADARSTCYALRSYTFKPEDLRSNSPRPSSETTCTVASEVRRKEAGPANVR